MEKFLVVFRGGAGKDAEGPPPDAARWNAWFDGLGSALVDRGALSHGSVDMPSRLLGPKISSSPLSGYCIITATDFNDAVRLAGSGPIFDEKGSVEIAHLR